MADDGAPDVGAELADRLASQLSGIPSEVVDLFHSKAPAVGFFERDPKRLEKMLQDAVADGIVTVATLKEAAAAVAKAPGNIYVLSKACTKNRTGAGRQELPFHQYWRPFGGRASQQTHPNSIEVPACIPGSPPPVIKVVPNAAHQNLGDEEKTAVDNMLTLGLRIGRDLNHCAACHTMGTGTWDRRAASRFRGVGLSCSGFATRADNSVDVPAEPFLGQHGLHEGWRNGDTPCLRAFLLAFLSPNSAEVVFAGRFGAQVRCNSVIPKADSNLETRKVTNLLVQVAGEGFGDAPPTRCLGCALATCRLSPPPGFNLGALGAKRAVLKHWFRHSCANSCGGGAAKGLTRTGTPRTPLQMQEDRSGLPVRGRRFAFETVAASVVPLSPYVKAQLAAEACAPAVPKGWERRVSELAAEIWTEAKEATFTANETPVVDGLVWSEFPRWVASAARGVDLTYATNADDHFLDGIICEKVRMQLEMRAQDPEARPEAVTINLTREEWDGFRIDDLHRLDFVQISINDCTIFLAPANGDALAVREEEALRVRAAALDRSWINSSDIDDLIVLQ
jgi:hypothetical protein